MISHRCPSSFIRFAMATLSRMYVCVTKKHAGTSSFFRYPASARYIHSHTRSQMSDRRLFHSSLKHSDPNSTRRIRRYRSCHRTRSVRGSYPAGTTMKAWCYQGFGTPLFLSNDFQSGMSDTGRKPSCIGQTYYESANLHPPAPHILRLYQSTHLPHHSSDSRIYPLALIHFHPPPRGCSICNNTKLPTTREIRIPARQTTPFHLQTQREPFFVSFPTL